MKILILIQENTNVCRIDRIVDKSKHCCDIILNVMKIKCQIHFPNLLIICHHTSVEHLVTKSYFYRK